MESKKLPVLYFNPRGLRGELDWEGNPIDSRGRQFYDGCGVDREEGAPSTRESNGGEFQWPRSVVSSPSRCNSGQPSAFSPPIGYSA